MLNRRAFAAALASAGLATSTLAQGRFPSRAVRFVVPTSAGSGPDQIARVVGQALSEKWGQPVVIENRAGATGVIGFDAVAKAEPDGYTLLVTAHNVAIVPALQKTPFDLERDLAPVGRLATAGMVLVVHPSLHVKTLNEFVALVKASPGKYSYGSAGAGGTHHMMMELLKHEAGMKMVHVPYRGPGPILPDLLENRISAAFIAMPAAMAQVPTGRLQAIAVAGEKRLPQFPDVPSVAEQGFKAFDLVLWYGMFAPGGTPAPIVAQIDRDLRDVLASPKVVEPLRSVGIDASPMDSAHFRTYVLDDFRRYQHLVRDAGITAE